MAEFKYKAKNPKGQDVEGTVQAESKQVAVSLLKDRDHQVYSISEAEGTFSLSNLPIFGGVSDDEKVNFTQNLASMISAGLPLAEALEILEEQAESKKMQDIVNTLLNDVKSGLPLSESLTKFKDVFSKSYISLVKAGEASGNLDAVLDRLATTLQKQKEFKGKVKGALIYPVIIVIAMALVFVIIIVFVIPKLTEMYESLGVELPLPTKVMIWMSDFLRNRWYVVIAVIALTIFGFRRYKNTKNGKYTLAKLSFKVPVFGPLLKQKDLTEFSRSMALLVASGVSLLEALQISRDSVSNIIFRDSVDEFIDQVKKGIPLSQAVLKDENFPTLSGKMIKVGEETGTTDERLKHLSDYFEEEVDRKVQNLSTALEPMIMVVLGIMVATLIISVITPIYKLTSSF